MAYLDTATAVDQWRFVIQEGAKLGDPVAWEADAAHQRAQRLVAAERANLDGTPLWVAPKQACTAIRRAAADPQARYLLTQSTVPAAGMLVLETPIVDVAAVSWGPGLHRDTPQLRVTVWMDTAAVARRNGHDVATFVARCGPLVADGDATWGWAPLINKPLWADWDGPERDRVMWRIAAAAWAGHASAILPATDIAVGDDTVQVLRATSGAAEAIVAAAGTDADAFIGDDRIDTGWDIPGRSGPSVDLDPVVAAAGDVPALWEWVVPRGRDIASRMDSLVRDAHQRWPKVMDRIDNLHMESRNRLPAWSYATVPQVAAELIGTYGLERMAALEYAGILTGLAAWRARGHPTVTVDPQWGLGYAAAHRVHSDVPRHLAPRLGGAVYIAHATGHPGDRRQHGPGDDYLVFPQQVSGSPELYILIIPALTALTVDDLRHRQQHLLLDTGGSILQSVTRTAEGLDLSHQTIKTTAQWLAPLLDVADHIASPEPDIHDAGWLMGRRDESPQWPDYVHVPPGHIGMWHLPAPPTSS